MAEDRETANEPTEATASEEAGKTSRRAEAEDETTARTHVSEQPSQQTARSSPAEIS